MVRCGNRYEGIEWCDAEIVVRDQKGHVRKGSEGIEWCDAEMSM